MHNITSEDMISARQEWNHTLELLTGVDPKSFYVVISGIQNSGKSTLGNALLGDYQNKTFKVGDYRLTDKNEEKLSSDGITYVDTPGYGTTEEGDTLACQDAWRKANLVLFLHSEILGGADLKIEMDMLKELAQVLPDIKNRLLIVCTKISGMSTEESQGVARSFVGKANELLGVECNFQCVDTGWYQAAMSNSKVSEKLVEKSGINKVKEWITNNRDVKSPVEKLLSDARSKYILALTVCLEQLERELEESRDKSNRFRQALESSLVDILGNLSSLWQQCNDHVVNIKSLKDRIRELEDIY